MRLMLNGFDNPLVIKKGCPTELIIENQTLFARVVQSFYLQQDGKGIEPYAFFDEADKEIKSKGNVFVILNPFDLPWDDKAIQTALFQRLEDDLRLDYEQMIELQDTIERLKESLLHLSISLQSDYAVDVEWETKKYLKSLGFQIDYQKEDPLLDNLIKFFALLVDVGFDRVLIFANLEKFLSENELKTFVEQVNYFNLQVLLVENEQSHHKDFEISKRVIDQHFCEI